MAILHSGILSTPTGTISPELWISPKTKRFYTPKPTHTDRRTPAQLEHRRRMALAGHLLHNIYKTVIKPFWGRMTVPLTGFAMAQKGTLLNYYEVEGIPHLRPWGNVPESEMWYYVAWYPAWSNYRLVFYPQRVSGLPSNATHGTYIVHNHNQKWWFSGHVTIKGCPYVALPLWGQYSRAPLNLLVNFIYSTDSTGLVLLHKWRADYYVLGTWMLP